jgi:hypothetical protein
MVGAMKNDGVRGVKFLSILSVISLLVVFVLSSLPSNLIIAMLAMVAHLVIYALCAFLQFHVWKDTKDLAARSFVTSVLVGVIILNSSLLYSTFEFAFHR